ncbi:MAG: hypothetical protein V1644_00585 [Candidatus Micrarchaeota archaeon]
MGKPFSLVKRFHDVHYANVESLLSHASQVSANIMRASVVKKSVTRPLSDFTLQVKRVTPRFLSGRYDTTRITREVAKLRGIRLSPDTFPSLYTKVARAILRLKRRGEIPLTDVHIGGRPRKLPMLQEATPEKIESNMHLVHRVLRTNHPFSIAWRTFLSETDAIEAGRCGLIRAIETHDPQKGSFSTHARNQIAGYVSNAIKKAARRREYSFHASGVYGKRALEDKISVSAPNPEAFQDNLTVLLKKKRRLESHHVLLWTLVNVFGHSRQELANHFNVARNSIAYLVKKAQKELPKR